MAKCVNPLSNPLNIQKKKKSNSIIHKKKKQRIWSAGPEDIINLGIDQLNENNIEVDPKNFKKKFNKFIRDKCTEKRARDIFEDYIYSKYLPKIDIKEKIQQKVNNLILDDYSHLFTNGIQQNTTSDDTSDASYSKRNKKCSSRWSNQDRNRICKRHNKECAGHPHICSNYKHNITAKTHKDLNFKTRTTDDGLEYDLDHIKEYSKSGNNAISNMQPLCLQCHRFKTSIFNSRDTFIIDESTPAEYRQIIDQYKYMCEPDERKKIILLKDYLQEYDYNLEENEIYLISSKIFYLNRYCKKNYRYTTPKDVLDIMNKKLQKDERFRKGFY